MGGAATTKGRAWRTGSCPLPPTHGVGGWGWRSAHCDSVSRSLIARSLDACSSRSSLKATAAGVGGRGGGGMMVNEACHLHQSWRACAVELRAVDGAKFSTTEVGFSGQALPAHASAGAPPFGRWAARRGGCGGRRKRLLHDCWTLRGNGEHHIVSGRRCAGTRHRGRQGRGGPLLGGRRGAMGPMGLEVLIFEAGKVLEAGDRRARPRHRPNRRSVGARRSECSRSGGCQIL